MFAFNFKPPQDPHKPAPPVISFKPKDKPKVKKLEVVEEVKEEVKTPEAPKKQVSKVKEEMPKMEVINEVIEKPNIEEPKPEAPKKKRIVAGSEEAKEWGKMMKARREAKKILDKELLEKKPIENELNYLV